MVISIDPHGAASRQPGRLQQKRRPPPGIYQCWKVTQYSTATTTATTTTTTTTSTTTTITTTITTLRTSRTTQLLRPFQEAKIIGNNVLYKKVKKRGFIHDDRF